jgi:hypothetical protein
MAIQNQDKGSNGGADENPREQLAASWGQMTANMVSPSGNGNGNGRASNGNGNGKPKNGRSPLPISALPLPAEDVPTEEPARSLPTNSQGKLSPAQRARLGLDPYGDDMPDAEPPAEPEPVPEIAPAPAPAAEQQQAAPTEFDFSGIDPYAQVPDPAPNSAANAAAQQGPAAIPEQPVEQPQFAPISNEPRLAPVSNEPRLAPVNRAAETRRANSVQSEAEFQRNSQPRGKKQRDEDSFEAVARDRGVLAYGLAWTAFAVVVTSCVAFSSAIGGDPASATGPGPLVPGLLSIAIGWVIVLVARGVGRGWGALMLIPALVLFIGPYMYRQYWSTSVEDAARSYLSTTGNTAKVDVDSTSIVSETVNTDRGCFSINRTRSNNNTEVSVVTYVPTTARQQADFALAPRYAGRIPAGGERTTSRVFSFLGGRAPAQIQLPREATLDCANSTSAPGTGADPARAEAQDAE